MNAKRATIVFFMMLLCIAIAINPLTANAVNLGITPTAKSSQNSKIEVSKNNPRISEINRVLGTSISTLQKMSPSELKALIVANADKLGMMVYEVNINEKGESIRTLKAGKKVFKAADFKNNSAVSSAYPAPAASTAELTASASATSSLASAYPAPAVYTSKTVVTQAQTAQTSENTLTTTSKVYVPLVSKPSGDATLDNVLYRMGQAKVWVDGQYNDNLNYGYVKEYPGCPLSIYNYANPNGQYSKRFAGDYYVTKATPVGKVLTNYVGYAYDWSDYTFEAGDTITSGWNYNQPSLDCDIYYLSNGQSQYIVTKTGWDNTGPNLTQTLYLGDTVLFNDIASTPDGTTATVVLPVNGRYAAARYTIRHATSLGALFYEKYTDPWKVQQLNNTRNQWGFGTLPDLYTPLFETGTWASDDYMFQPSLYHDCDLWSQGLDSTIPATYLPYTYPYESKVCATGRLPYIELSRLDYLVPALQALHILNKYSDPDHVYNHPSGVGTTTPRQIARWLETKWTGFGIPVYLKSTDYVSGIRTNAFLGLEAKMGYQYGDATSKTYADNTANVLMRVQWGSPPFTEWTGTTVDNGSLFRTIHQGGQLLMWTSSLTLAPSGGILTDIVDMFSMPNEAIFPQPSNVETTVSYWSSLNLYAKYKYGSGQ